MVLNVWRTVSGQLQETKSLLDRDTLKTYLESRYRGFFAPRIMYQ